MIALAVVLGLLALVAAWMLWWKRTLAPVDRASAPPPVDRWLVPRPGQRQPLTLVPATTDEDLALAIDDAADDAEDDDVPRETMRENRTEEAP